MPTVMRLLTRIMARLGAEELLARLMGVGDCAVILCYHNVVEDDPRGERSLHVPVAVFCEQITAMQQHRTIIPLAELLERLRSGLPVSQTAVLSFDDAYRGVLQHAIPYLTARSIPATLFPVAGLMESDRPFWWDRMAEMGGGEVAGRDRILQKYTGGEPDWNQDQIAVNPKVHLPTEYSPAGRAELNALDPDLVSLGVHTVNHPNLTALPADRIREELHGAEESMRELRPSFVQAVAYPFGYHNQTVERVTHDLGLAGLSLEARPVSRSALPIRLPRFFVDPRVTGSRLKLLAIGIG